MRQHSGTPKTPTEHTRKISQDESHGNRKAKVVSRSTDALKHVHSSRSDREQDAIKAAPRLLASTMGLTDTDTEI